MKQRQNPQQCIVRSNIYPVEYGFDFAHEIGVRQHNALRVGSGSGGIKQRRKIITAGGSCFKTGGASFENRREIRQPMFVTGSLGCTIRIHKNEAELQFGGCGTNQWDMFRIAEDRRGAAIF